jgi:hypothetical protein
LLLALISPFRIETYSGAPWAFIFSGAGAIVAIILYASLDALRKTKSPSNRGSFTLLSLFILIATALAYGISMQSATDNELAYHNLRGYWVVFLVSALVGYKIASTYAASMANVDDEDSAKIDKQKEEVIDDPIAEDKETNQNHEENDHNTFVSPL